MSILFGLFTKCKQFPEHKPSCLVAVIRQQLCGSAVDALNKCLNFWVIQQPVCCGADITVSAAVCGIGIPISKLLGFAIGYRSDEHKLLCAWLTRLPGYPRIAFFCTHGYPNNTPIFHNLRLTNLFVLVNLMVQYINQRLPILQPVA